MKAFIDHRQSAHDPKYFMANGNRLRNPEIPARVSILRKGAEAAGCSFSAPEDHGLGPIAAIHTAEYLSFLKNIYTRWQRIEGAGDEVIPNIHPANRSNGYPMSAVGQAGYHQADTACPISSATWKSAYWSAQSALNAAKTIIEGDRAAYALCRPPGHHAFSDLAGGFCFLNNSAIVAQALLTQGLRPAILDVDVHHGNGTQGIFYNRADVLTVSIHADPARFYPFFWGYSNERGEADGLGANLNLPLPRGSDDAGFLSAVDTALDRIDAFAANVIVVALGLDAHEDDPFQGLAVTTKGFRDIAAAISDRNIPMVLIQEGGYVSNTLGDNITSFFTGINSG
jgi:acetoin utilization deacetylase AcuC-like enzyme